MSNFQTNIMLIHTSLTFWAPSQYKDRFSRYGYSHNNENPFTGKTAFLYWDGPLIPLVSWSCRITSCISQWGRVTRICVGNVTIISSDNGLSPGRRQVIIWTSAGILLIGPLRINNEILFGVQTFPFTKIHLKMSSAKWRPFYPGLNVICKNHVHDKPMVALRGDISRIDALKAPAILLACPYQIQGGRIHMTMTSW